MCNAACAEGTLLACENTCPALLTNHFLGVHFRHKFCEKLSTSKLPLLFIHEHVLWKCLCLIPEMGFHPTDTASSIAARCMKVPEQMGECHYLIFQWVIHGLFPFSLHFCLDTFSCRFLAYFSLLRHWRCAYLSSAVSRGLWWNIRIADGERVVCLNAAWCFPKLRALKPSRHEPFPVTAWCLPLQLLLSLGRKLEL